MTLRSRLASFWAERPEVAVLALAALARLAAAILSRGFAFHDDHFEVVEVAQRWLAGHRDWLGSRDSLRCLLYPGAHWAVFAAAEALGLRDPQAKMLAVRLLNGAWSLAGVAYGMRVAVALLGRERARLSGLLLALFWVSPFAAVHDLVEAACAPALLAALWCLVRRGGEATPRDAALAGAWLGLAFAIRFQTAVFTAGVGLVLLAQRRLRAAAALGAGTLASAALLVGGTDWLGYGAPFSSLRAYVAHNAAPGASATYPTGPWYQYLLTLAGVLLPPASLLILAGAVRARRLALLFWPALAFLAFHSAYPGKQERFLFPILPVVLILGAAGAADLAAEARFLRERPRLVRGLWIWFWAANALLLALYSGNYSKRTRVEPLSFLRATGEARSVVVETTEASAPFVPRFYLGTEVPMGVLPASRSIADLERELVAAGAPPPTHVVAMGEPGLEARLERLRSLCAAPRLLATFHPGAVDGLLHRLNPRRNVNLVARVYRCERGTAPPAPPGPTP